MGRLRRLDWLNHTVGHDVVNDWDQIQKQFSGLDHDQCMRDMHVITQSGATYKGFDAYRSLAWVVPILWPILPLLYLPPVRWVGNKIYRRVADNRSCDLPR